MEGFVRAARIAFERGEVELGKTWIRFVVDLIDVMSMPPSRNVPVPDVPHCDVIYTERADCMGSAGGDQSTCQAQATCCYDNSQDGNLAPWCYKQVDYRSTNPLLVTVSDAQGSYSVFANANEGCGSSDQNTDGYAFKGHAVRFMGYALRMIELDMIPRWSHYLPSNTASVVAQGKACLSAMCRWVLLNSKVQGTNQYINAWYLDSTKTQLTSPFCSGSIPTFGVVELVNACYLLGVSPTL